MTSRPGSPSPRVRRMAWPAAVLGVALLLVVIGAPGPVRAAVSLPAIVGVTGLATTRLVLGPGADRLIRLLLGAVLGVVLLLLAVLLTALLGLPLGSAGVVLGSAVVALLLLGAAEVGRGRTVVTAGPATRAAPAAYFPAPPRQPRPPGLLAAAGVAAAALLVGAVTVAADFRPPAAEPYTLLSFTDPALLGPDPVVALPAAAVRLPVGLTSYGYPLPSDHPEIEVVLAGRPATAVVSWQTIPAVGPPGAGTVRTRSVSEQRGELTFTAPRAPGLYAVELRTAGTTAADPLVLTTYLQVSGS